MKKTDLDKAKAKKNNADQAFKKALELAKSSENKKLKKYLEAKKDYLEYILTKDIESKNLDNSLIGVVIKKNKMVSTIIEYVLKLPLGTRLSLLNKLQSHIDPGVREFTLHLKQIIINLTLFDALKRLDENEAFKEALAAVGENEVTYKKKKDADKNGENALRQDTSYTLFAPVPSDVSQNTSSIIDNLLTDLRQQQDLANTNTSYKILRRIPTSDIRLLSPTIVKDSISSSSTTHLSAPKSCLSSNYTKALVVFACALVLASAYFVNLISKGEINSGREF